MATKSQKREASIKKREEFLAGVKADGLAAQERSKRSRKQQELADTVVIQDINRRHAEILDKHRCPKCQELVGESQKVHHPNYCLGG
jgi:formylmethanofuran dehydrogenase subunit E